MNKVSSDKQKADPKAIVLVAKEEEKEERMAELMLRPNIQSASIVKFLNNDDDGVNINALISELEKQSQAVKDGKLDRLEDMLIAQAHALDAIFGALTRRSIVNLGEYRDAAERYMRLGFKAQSQCRATLETLAAIKNPPVVWAKQANIAHGPQQVNNGTLPFAQAGKSEIVQNELLENKGHEVERVDFGSTQTTSQRDPAMETVGAINRRKNTGGQSEIRKKRL